MESIIIYTLFRCPMCGFQSNQKNLSYEVFQCPRCSYQSFEMFPLKEYNAGSSGLRTCQCPNCMVELEYY